MKMDYYLHSVEDGKTSLLQTLRQTIFECHFTAGVRDLTTSLISEQLLELLLLLSWKHLADSSQLL